MTKRTRTVLAGVVVTGALALGPATAASAHVHGITPLLRCGIDLDGANRTDTTPAAAANGGPISGLIPSTVGNASVEIGDGGFSAPACDANS